MFKFISFFHTRIGLLLQLVLTFSIIFFLSSSITQLLLLVCLWLATFWPLKREEIIVFLIAAILGTLGDVAVVHARIFEFATKDLLSLPLYEPLIWGYLYLQAKRILYDKDRLHSDLTYISYCLLVGFGVETLGTHYGTWFYNFPRSYIWWALNWAAAGFILRRVLIPLEKRIPNLQVPSYNDLERKYFSDR